MLACPRLVATAEQPTIETIGEIIPRIVEALFKQNLGSVVCERRRHSSIRAHRRYTSTAAAARPAPTSESVTSRWDCTQCHCRAAGVRRAARRAAGDTAGVGGDRA